MNGVKIIDKQPGHKNMNGSELLSQLVWNASPSWYVNVFTIQEYVLYILLTRRNIKFLL